VRTRTLVVAGLITANDGRLLITQRRADQFAALGWEFPGGKLEPEESPESALRRELREEIDARAEIGRIWEVLFHPYPDFDLLMLVYHCRLLPGESARAREVADLAWCEVAALGDYDIMNADLPLVARLQREGVPAWVR